MCSKSGFSEGSAVEISLSPNCEISSQRPQSGEALSHFSNRTVIFMDIPSAELSICRKRDACNKDG